MPAVSTYPENLAIAPEDTPPFIPFPSRRSVVQSANGIVSCTQPLAAQAGLKVLRDGGNAAVCGDSACLNVTEPSSTGIGGDVFCLFYDAKTKQVRGINGSGRSPGAITLAQVRADLGLPPVPPENESALESRIPMTNVHAVTVPGAAAGWCDVIEKFGSGNLSMGEVLAEAIRLAEEGFPVSQLASRFWHEGKDGIQKASPNWPELMKNGERPPREGEIMRMKNLAGTFRELAEKGKKGFYEGRIAREIVDVLKERGGVMSLEDLKRHGEIGSEEISPIALEYGIAGLKLWECSPNGQGLVALMALGILESLQVKGVIPVLGSQGVGYEHNSADYLHAVIEALRIAFADGHWFITDPQVEKAPVEGLLDKLYLSNRSKIFNPERINPNVDHGSPAFHSSDTVYFSVTDKDGNGCSFIKYIHISLHLLPLPFPLPSLPYLQLTPPSSLYGGFGSGIIPKGCGFTLQNRGAGFVLREDHPNRLAPNKRPYHTIIPAMITDAASGDLHTVFGVMGGFNQPQGHVQVFLNMVAFGMSPQAAVDAPRICIGMNYDPTVLVVNVEEGISAETVEELKKRGHDVKVVTGYGRGVFGRGQVIRAHYDKEDGNRRVYSAGSDLRGDGHAVGY
ncbi:hypothetical protein RUND412_004330 [Rhizina undulata]